MEYLRGRGLSDDTISRFALGFLSEPEPGDERMKGRISIPYSTWCPVKGRIVHYVKYRAIDDSRPKYDMLGGATTRIFNSTALDEPSHFVCICEGEFDAMSATQAGLPAVGIAGVKVWKQHYGRLFKYPRIYILADTDDKGQGMEFADALASKLRNTKIVPIPGDVNAYLAEHGEVALRELVGIESN